MKYFWIIAAEAKAKFPLSKCLKHQLSENLTQKMVIFNLELFFYVDGELYGDIWSIGFRRRAGGFFLTQKQLPFDVLILVLHTFKQTCFNHSLGQFECRTIKSKQLNNGLTALKFWSQQSRNSNFWYLLMPNCNGHFLPSWSSLNLLPKRKWTFLLYPEGRD